ncbi:RNA-binding protein [Corchorus olitorius]|uniref:RNA-binding protein n=1 Tax=Corchorus olitorius TaxID=93759 RepID=A0A1R3KEB6_9ROSI|nr:RNA-binding protein [Corchorus olitorius]
MAANTQQFGSREDYSREGNTRRINEVSTHSTSLEQQLQETNQQVATLTDLFNAHRKRCLFSARETWSKPANLSRTSSWRAIVGYPFGTDYRGPS